MVGLSHSDILHPWDGPFTMISYTSEVDHSLIVTSYIAEVGLSERYPTPLRWASQSDILHPWGGLLRVISYTPEVGLSEWYPTPLWCTSHIVISIIPVVGLLHNHIHYPCDGPFTMISIFPEVDHLHSDILHPCGGPLTHSDILYPWDGPFTIISYTPKVGISQWYLTSLRWASNNDILHPCVRPLTYSDILHPWGGLLIVISYIPVMGILHSTPLWWTSPTPWYSAPLWWASHSDTLHPVMGLSQWYPTPLKWASHTVIFYTPVVGLSQWYSTPLRWASHTERHPTPLQLVCHAVFNHCFSFAEYRNKWESKLEMVSMNCLVGKRQNEMLVGNEQKMPVYGKTGKIKWNGNDMEKFYTRGTTGGRRH